MVYRLFYRLLAAVGKDLELARSCGHIHSTQGVAVFTTLGVLPAVDYKVHLQKSEAALVPIAEGSDRDLLFEKSSGLRCALLPFRRGPVGTKEAVDGGRAHLHKEFLRFRPQLEHSFLLEGGHNLGKGPAISSRCSRRLPIPQEGQPLRPGCRSVVFPSGPSALTFFRFEEAGWRNFR